MNEPILPEDGVFKIVKAGWYQISLAVHPGGQTVSELRLISADDPPRDDVDRIVQEQMREDALALTNVRLTVNDPEPESTSGDLWIDDNAPTESYAFLVKLDDGWLWASHQDERINRLIPGDTWAIAMGHDQGPGLVVRRPTEQEKARYYGSSE